MLWRFCRQLVEIGTLIVIARRQGGEGLLLEPALFVEVPDGQLPDLNLRPAQGLMPRPMSCAARFPITLRCDQHRQKIHYWSPDENTVNHVERPPVGGHQRAGVLHAHGPF